MSEQAGDGFVEHLTRQERWDRHYLALARFWAELKSKDPSTKVGAVVVDVNNNVAALGYNGFPRGVEDREDRYNEREVKYALVMHAEANALLLAGERARGGTLYGWPLFTCNECAKLVIQSGIARVVTPPPAEERWQSSYEWSKTMYREAGVEVLLYPNV